MLMSILLSRFLLATKTQKDINVDVRRYVALMIFINKAATKNIRNCDKLNTPTAYIIAYKS